MAKQTILLQIFCDLIIDSYDVSKDIACPGVILLGMLQKYYLLDISLSVLDGMNALCSTNIVLTIFGELF